VSALPESEILSLDEAVRLSAADSVFYSRFFFPAIFRQDTPELHRELWDLLEIPNEPYIGVKMFRGSAKTTLARVFASKRIAFAMSRLLLFVSNAEARAVDSLEWLKQQVEYNTTWAHAFQLRKGGKWNAEEIEIIHGIEEIPIYGAAAGISGSIRGLNINGYRPDFIMCDDVDKEETVSTPEQRKKGKDLFFGTVQKALVPTTENVLAKMLLLQTPLDSEDTIEVCAKDAQWHVLDRGCFDTRGLSRWESRFPTEKLLEDKAAHSDRGQMGLWMREMECKIIAPELASFREAWLVLFEIAPEGMWTIIAIDPASSESKTADMLAMVVLGFRNGHVYLLDYFLARGAEPDKVANQMFSFIYTYRPRNIVVETIAYQRVLAWYLRREMDKQRVYVAVKEVQDRRKKSDRIIQAISGIASHGKFHVKRSQAEFYEQYLSYHPMFRGHEDLLDAIALGITAQNFAELDAIDADYAEIEEEERKIPALSYTRSAP
jgi:hypothetical protein